MTNIALLVVGMFAVLAFVAKSGGLNALLMLAGVIGFVLSLLVVWGVWIQNNVRI